MASKRSVGTMGEADLKGKKVFIRADLNVPLDGLLAAPRCGNVSTLVKFTYDEIKSTTGGSTRDSIIGHGGFGNVYKGVLSDGIEVAVKRFKN
jgi:hypothetical protein